MVYHIDTTPADFALSWMSGNMTPVTVVGAVAVILIARTLIAAFFPRKYR
jgi:hypothetical protein